MSFEVLLAKKGINRLFCVCTCQNATSLEILCPGSYEHRVITQILLTVLRIILHSILFISDNRTYYIKKKILKSSVCI